MKYVVVVMLLFFLFLLPVSGENPVIKFAEPSSWRYTGMAGAITAFPEGLDILIHNPAGLTENLFFPKKRFVLNFSTQFYFKPQFLFPILKDIVNVQNKLGQILLNAKDLITSSGFGGTPTISFGYMGKNWGLGLLTTTSVFVQGNPFPLGVEGFAMVNITVPVAYSLKVVEARSLDISLGTTFHPSVALYKMIDGSNVDAIISGDSDIQDILEGILSTPYVSFPFDLGVILSAYDVLYSGNQLRVGAVVKNMYGDYFVPGQSVEPLPRELSFNLGIGIVFPVYIGKLPIDIVLSGESKAINQLISGSQRFFKSLAFGLEVAVANVVRFWAGLSSGYPTMGGKLTLGIFSVGVSWQTMESGHYVGDNPLSIFHLGFSFDF